MATTMRPLGKVLLGADAASIDFVDIPGNYADLVVYLSCRTTAAVNAQSTAMNMSINGVTTNRTYRRLEASSGTTVASDNGTAAAVSTIPGTSVTASTFSNVSIYLPNYAGSTNKSFSAEAVVENNSATNNDISCIAGLWSSTAAITQLTFSPGSGNFASGSSVFLYGITKA